MSTLNPDPIQQQLIEARRQQIIEAATKVFAEKGFHKATIKDVARAANVADGTIYNYFENKTALLFGIFDFMRETILRNAPVPSFINGDARSFIKAYLHHPLMAFKSDNFDLFRIIIAEVMVNDELKTLYYQRLLVPTLTGAEMLLQHWADQGFIRPVNVKVTVRVLSSIIIGLMVQHIMGDETLQTEWDMLPDLIADLLLNGLESDSS